MDKDLMAKVNVLLKAKGIRELSMDEILEIKENAEVEIEILVHGMSCMFQSR